MHARTLVALGCVSFGTFLLATLPATLVTPRLEASTGGNLMITQATGTVWKGHGRLVAQLPGGAPVRIDRLAWTFQPLALFRGRAAMRLDAALGKLEARATLARTFLAWEMRDVSVQGPVAPLAALHPVLAAWQPGGSLAIESAFLRHDTHHVTGSASAVWRDATLSSSAVRPVGTWQLDMAADAGPAKLTLGTLRGPLRLSGQGSVTPAGKVTFSGEARAEAGRDADLASLLDAIGPRRGDGAYPFTLP